MSHVTKIDWNSGDKSGLVYIGTHSLWLHANGPSRKENEPAVIIVQGLGASIMGWVAVRRNLAPFVRVYAYDRAGFGDSDVSPNPPKSTTIAQELHTLLRHANIPPPYILVAHSWGGILSREFLALCQRDVIGMVFIEANQEHTLEVLDWREVAFSPVLAGVDRAETTGILHSHKLTQEEWELYEQAGKSEKHQKQATLEFELYEESFSTLGEKRQLSMVPPLLRDRPVYVIRGDNGGDFQKLYDAGVKMGNGNSGEREQFQAILQTWDEKDRALQKGHLALSNTNHYTEVSDAGHDLQLTAPRAIADGVKWVINNGAY